MAVSRTDEITDISKSLEGVGIDFGDPFKDSSIESSNAVLLGATLRTSTSFGKAATVAPGEDIRVAINALKSAGGGTLILLAGTHRPTYDIEGDSSINIIGEGIDKTIIDFVGGNYQLKYVGATEDSVSNFRIADLTIKNNSDTELVLLDNTLNTVIENLLIEDATNDGITIETCNNIYIRNVIAQNNGGYGFGSSLPDAEQLDFFNCQALSNTGTGFDFSAAGGVYIIRMLNCQSQSNGADGYSFNTADSANLSMYFCSTFFNGANGFTFDSISPEIYGCSAISDDDYGFDLIDDSGIYVGCKSGGVSLLAEIRLTGSCSSRFIGTAPNGTGLFSETNQIVEIESNPNGADIQNKKIRRYKNTSGGTLSAGSVVVLKSVAAGDEMTTTTTAGDDKVLGVVLESTSNNNTTRILKEGKTTLLKVDGTTDIAFGDFLMTGTTASVAVKGTSGKICFAIALESYTTDDANGVIDALLVTPRQIA